MSTEIPAFPPHQAGWILLFLTKHMPSQHISKLYTDMFSTSSQAMPYVTQPQPATPHSLQVRALV
jgi:hypothetical protein